MKPIILPPSNSRYAACYYLAGGMQHSLDHGAGWRQQVKDCLSYINFQLEGVVAPISCFDPTDLSNEQEIFAAYGFTKDGKVDIDAWKLALHSPEKVEPAIEVMKHFINKDLLMLRRHCDGVIAYWDLSVTKGAGTQGEITYFYAHHRSPIYIIMGNDLKPLDLPAWILGCATYVFESLDEFMLFLTEFMDPNGPYGPREDPLGDFVKEKLKAGGVS